jgi:hypothetical protein
MHGYSTKKGAMLFVSTTKKNNKCKNWCQQKVQCSSNHIKRLTVRTYFESFAHEPFAIVLQGLWGSVIRDEFNVPVPTEFTMNVGDESDLFDLSTFGKKFSNLQTNHRTQSINESINSPNSQQEKKEKKTHIAFLGLLVHIADKQSARLHLTFRLEVLCQCA